MEELQDSAKNKKVAFSNFIRTDGFTADVVLIKSSGNKINDDYYEQDYDVTLLGEVTTKEEVDEMTLCGIDPNRGQVFAASYGYGEESHQVRSCSTREYYTYTGSIRHQRKEQQRMEDSGMDDILLNIPTAKTAFISRYLQFVVYILLNITAILNFNNTSTAARRFHLYQGVQRAREEMVNILVNGGKKYNKAKRKNLKKNRRKRKKKRDTRGSPTSHQMYGFQKLYRQLLLLIFYVVRLTIIGRKKPFLTIRKSCPLSRLVTGCLVKTM